MASTYTTISGQTWDEIAYEAYGDEHCCSQLMDANRDKLDYFVFPDGIVLTLPELEEVTENTVSSDYPLWRSELNNG